MLLFSSNATLTLSLHVCAYVSVRGYLTQWTYSAVKCFANLNTYRSIVKRSSSFLMRSCANVLDFESYLNQRFFCINFSCWNSEDQKLSVTTKKQQKEHTHKTPKHNNKNNQNSNRIILQHILCAEFVISNYLFWLFFWCVCVLSDAG